MESPSQTPTHLPPSLTPAAPRTFLSPGVTFGRYRVERLIGMGGMGEVYEAEDLESGRRVALKVLGRGLTDEGDRQRFLREGRLAASVNHPHTVYVFGTEQVDGVPVITMELAAGGTLKDRVAASGPLRAEDAVAAILQLTEGLEAAEAVGVLHRDVKPSNCFVEADGTVKIGDFGLSISTLARSTDVTGTSDPSRAGTFVGTPAFAPPEQLRGNPLDVRADIYSVCATLYYLLTGRAPFEEPNLIRLVTMVAQEPPASAHTIRPAVPRGLAAVVARGLSKGPEQRFASYAALRAALAPYRPDAVGPATLGLRFLAGAVDAFALNLIQSVLVLALPAGWVGVGLPAYARSYVVMALYFGISESAWGASPGKELFALRVVNTSDRPAAARQVVLRAALYAVVWTAPMVLSLVIAQAGNLPDSPLERAALRGQVLMATFVAGMLLLFSTARRGNGFAGIHELLTGTRVVTQSIARAIRAPESRVDPPALSPQLSTIGPYAIVADLGGGLSRGFDATLGRYAWIRTTPQAVADPDLRRRTMSRRTRLRWLAGGSSGDRRWNAFEAPPGQALVQLQHPQPWHVVREWLADLASELASGLDDGSLPPLDLDRLWVSANSRAWLLDFPAPGTAASGEPVDDGPPPDLASAQKFLHLVAERALRGPRSSATTPVLPRAAGDALRQLKDQAIASAHDLRAVGEAMVAGPAAVTRRRRALQLALSALPALGLLQSTAMTFMQFPPNPRFTSTWLDRLPTVVESGFIEPLMNVGALSIAFALLLRVGPTFRACGLTIVTADGQPAARWRTVLRALVAWGPLIVFSIGLVNDTDLLVNPAVSAFLRGPVPVVAYPLLLIGGVAAALITPQRGLPDRLAGTYLVPSN